MKAPDLICWGVLGIFGGVSGYSQTAPAPVEPAAPAAVTTSTVSSSVKGNIFTANEGALVLQLAKPETVTGGKVTLRDENGKATTLPLAAGAGEFTIPLAGKGYYAVEAEILRESGKEKLTTTAAVVGPLLDEAVRMKSPLGLWTVQGDP